MLINSVFNLNEELFLGHISLFVYKTEISIQSMFRNLKYESIHIKNGEAIFYSTKLFRHLK